MIYPKKITLLIVCLCFSIAFAQAQPGGGGPPGGGQPVPVTGIEILLVAGGLLGVKRILNRKTK